MTSKLSATLCTTLGNHDIRGNGRNIYTMLYGPPYYSFDYGDDHFIFLDSSRGWSEKTSIPDEQYIWLENDLKKSSDKHIYVISHIPTRDPRSGVKPNEIPNLVDNVENETNWVEKKLSDYNESKDMDHGFQDPIEAKKFEKLMSEYNVESVYLSHIHSYLEYKIDDVNYIITGGAGAELLTKNSYYHYMIAKLVDPNRLISVELPSPTNFYLSRYSATVKLFSSAMYEENPISVILIITGFAILLILIVIKIYLWKKRGIDTIGSWLKDMWRYGKKSFKSRHDNNDKQ